MKEFIGGSVFCVSRCVYREESVSVKSLDGSRSTTVEQRGRGGSGIMNPTLVGTIVFACTLGGALIGLWLRTKVPAHHLTEESRDTVKLGIGLVATMTALVLGLVTASAKSSFDAVDTAVKHTALDILILDRLLARYGPETSEIRGALQHAFARRIDMIWPQSSSRPVHLDPKVGV